MGPQFSLLLHHWCAPDVTRWYIRYDYYTFDWLTVVDCLHQPYATAGFICCPATGRHFLYYVHVVLRATLTTAAACTVLLVDWDGGYWDNLMPCLPVLRAVSPPHAATGPIILPTTCTADGFQYRFMTYGYAGSCYLLTALRSVGWF